MKLRVGLNEDSQLSWQSQNLERLRYEYDLKPDDLVIDIGAYMGEWANGIYDRYGCRIIAIEPTPHIRGFKNGGVINKAAGMFEGELCFGGHYYYSSVFEPGGGAVYPCFDINTLLAQQPEIALCKINIEGAEYELLKHIMAAGYHKNIRDLQVQFHQIEDAPFQQWYDTIKAGLEETHTLTYHYPFCWENWRRC